MSEINIGEPFGMDAGALSAIDWDLAVNRIIQDLRSDFIYAPHLGFIYQQAGADVADSVRAELRNGKHSPGLPLTIEVPKTFRIRVKAGQKRLGPNYSRPGSILMPRDRLLYQALADQAAPIVAMKTDAQRAFSHLLAPPDSASMFYPTRYCWNQLQKALTKNSQSKKLKYVVRLDVANFFGSINQHILINVLRDSGYSTKLIPRLEAILTRYTGERSSRGILQGMYPSDLFGNYYLAPVDRFLKEYGVQSARYVDDIYVFVESVESADQLLRALIPELRSYDLVLNEAKSVIIPKAALVTEEPDLEALFTAAIDEIANQVKDEDFDADYGFQSEWEEEAEAETDLELEATKVLFDSLSEYPGNEENIERFCLPLFSKARSDYAVDHVIASFKKRPSMAQIYASYLAKFLPDLNVQAFLLQLLTDGTLVDWQRMWVLAGLSQINKASDNQVKVAWDLLKDTTRHEGLRAVAAVFVGRFGDHSRRKALAGIYSSVSNYVQAAIFYSSRRWPSVERNNAKANWSGHGGLHNLISLAMSKKKAK